MVLLALVKEDGQKGQRKRKAKQFPSRPRGYNATYRAANGRTWTDARHDRGGTVVAEIGLVAGAPKNRK